MARAIWKFPLDIVDLQAIEMPDDAEILCCQEQDDRPCLWAAVTPGKSTRRRWFRVFGTGHPMPHERGMRYIGTAQTLLGVLVWHVFEVPEPEARG